MSPIEIDQKPWTAMFSSRFRVFVYVQYYVYTISGRRASTVDMQMAGGESLRLLV